MRRLAALLVLLLFPAVASAQTVVINSNIAVNTTWGPTGTVVGDVFWVQGSRAINSGVTLTIEPGVIVKFDVFSSFTVNGTLTVNGGAGNEVIFTSIRDDVGGDTNGDGNATLPNSSDWAGLTFPDAAPDASVLDYADIRYGGYFQRGALLFDNNSSTVTNSFVRSGYYGVDCRGSAAPTLTNTTIEASTQTPIVLDFTATPVLSSLVFSTADNGYDAFGLRGGFLTSAATLPQRGATVGVNPISNVTYVLLSTLTINSGGDLTVDPGVVIKPVAASIVVNSGGNLALDGTAAAGDTITITSINDDNFGLPGDTNNNGSITAPIPGNWGGVIYGDGATGSVSHARLKFGTNTATAGMVQMTNTSVAVTNVLLSDASHGLALFGTSAPTISNVDINNCTSTPVLQSVSAAPQYSGIGLTANAITAIGVQGEAVGVDSRLPVTSLGGFDNITYYIMNGRVTMNSPAILTIDPGVVIKNQLQGGGITVNGGLVADAKPESLIVFTSERDDLYGNPADTNGDGASTSPAQGDWTYLQYTGTSNDGVNVLDNCRITYGSYGPFTAGSTNLLIQNAAPTVTNTFIAQAQYGIRMDGDAAPTIDMCDINNCQFAPYIMSAVSDPNITVNNTYSSNGFNAIALHTETLAQDATIKYRPGVGSPTFAYLPVGQITVGSGTTLSIEPQVVIKPSATFVVFNVNGALNIVGSNNTTGRVIFTSRFDDNPLYGGDTTPLDATAPTAGNWGHIQFNDTSVDAACIIRNTLFQFGGAFGQASGVLTTVSASPRFVSNEFFQNVTTMTFKGTSAAVVDSTTILNCTQIPLSKSLVSNPQFPNPSEIVLANNTYTAFGLLNETISQDVHTGIQPLGSFDSIDYAPIGTITIAFGAKWTIAPGVVVKFGRRFIDPFGVTITVNGALVADGKPDSLIIFTSLADDAFGNDVQGDGAATVPAAGNWDGILFNATSDDINTVVDHVRLRYGGYGGWGAFNFSNAGPTITNTYSSINASFGALIQGSSTPTFIDCKMDSSFLPVHMSLVSDPTFTNVEFLGNTNTALSIIPETIAQDVLWPIRAVSGRSNMPYYLSGQLTTGLGATVRLQPGLVIKSTSGNGQIFIQRSFIAEGTTDSLIVFTSRAVMISTAVTRMVTARPRLPPPPAGVYVTVDGTAIDPEVRFKNCVFRYGGTGTTVGALRCVNSSPSIDSCLVTYNSVGISVEGASNPTITGSSLYGNTWYAVNNSGNSFCVNAEGNWWGAADGPNDASATLDLCSMADNLGFG